MLDEELLNNSGYSIETSKPLARKSQDLFYCREPVASPGNGASCPNGFFAGSDFLQKFRFQLLWPGDKILRGDIFEAKFTNYDGPIR